MTGTEGTVRRLALLGGESSGKTTLAIALAARLDTDWVPEYGRELWERLRRTLTVPELVHVAEEQMRLEDAAAAECRRRGRGWVVCDTTPLTTLQYCLHDHARAPAALQQMARRRYDLVAICAPDFEFVQDGCRRDDGFRRAQHAWTLARVAGLGLPTLHARGPLEARVSDVFAKLRAIEAGSLAPAQA